MIHFFSEDITFPDINQDIYSNWLIQVSASHSKKPGEINYIFCNDEKILSVNKEFLNHDYYTDIITFDYSDFPILSGDIYISVEMVLTNAYQLNISFETELKRVIVHGILHLCGFKDKTAEESDKMRKFEDDALKLLIN